MIQFLFWLGAALALTGTVGLLNARARAWMRRRELIDAFADREIERARRRKDLHAA